MNFEQLEKLHADLFCLENTVREYDSQIRTIRNQITTLENEAVEVLQKEKDQGSNGRIVGGTVYSLKWNPPKILVTDETKIPERFFKTERTLIKADLNKAVKEGESFEGVTFSNGSYSVVRKANLKGNTNE